ncbi:hypothetical protein AGABI1DRAFT_107998 [Agaricus bisporus var. burnettii JB137-S8]|uniref:FAR-17a/AIG1-like protein n=1 Tax=Agaricus bisporus var. burnettii (strain JB137-S8 / ATCC MYA-4627 / FGSC 10392) TaxID=597362 RepID=K5X2R7_AGABU|nr:uncharacterized protein AGABI1DRAFT_107998 [Agaricus bisporus var. burnettii JB137-S8]EKM77458.1 hypothetical protein AGABI1DRAFT_107998 [Agaricus bisporus var. burnettii JB137-S8]
MSRWFSYFTHLSLAGLAGHLTVSAYHGFRYKPSPSSVYSYPLQWWHGILKTSHICNISAVTTFPLLVTITYWTLIASSDTFSSTYNTWAAISKHILNTVLALSEITTTNIPPLPWKTLPVCLIILGAYLGLAYVTHATEDVYVYTFLDPEIQHWKLAIYITGIAAGEVIIFVLVLGRSSTSSYDQGDQHWFKNGGVQSGGWEAVPMIDAGFAKNARVQQR